MQPMGPAPKTTTVSPSSMPSCSWALVCTCAAWLARGRGSPSDRHPSGCSGAADALDVVRREAWNELRRLPDQAAAKTFKSCPLGAAETTGDLTDDQSATVRDCAPAVAACGAATPSRRRFARSSPVIWTKTPWPRCSTGGAPKPPARLAPFVKVAKTIRTFREGILAAINLGINNARPEGLNSHVRLITRRAYGFHSAEAALSLVMLSCGPIQLRLPHERLTARPTSMPSANCWLGSRHVVQDYCVAPTSGNPVRAGLVRLGEPAGRWVLLACVLGSALAFIDGTVVNIALPRIGQALDADAAGLQWTVNAYTLTLAAFILLA